MDHLKRLLFAFVMWLVVANLKFIRWLGKGEIGKIVFQNSHIIIFPVNSRQGYVLTAKAEDSNHER